MSLALLPRSHPFPRLGEGWWHCLSLLAALQILLWTAVPVLTYRSLPLDVVEGIVWGREWQWGYYKHPPLSSWLLAAAVELPGGLAWGPYLLSQLAVVATYLAVFRLGRTLLPPREALLGTLLLSGLYYFSYPTPEFNHNLLQMPLWALAILCYREARRTDRLGWWSALGALAALLLLTKYTAAFLLAAIGLDLLLTRGGRAALRRPGPWLALAATALLLLPHLLWLFARDFAPFAYADARARPLAPMERLLVPLRFLLVQLLDHAGSFALLAAGGLLRLGGKGEPAEREGLRFLLTFAIGPLALLLLASAVFGFGLRDMWGAPFFTLSGLLAIALCRRNWPVFRPQAFTAALAGLLLLVPAIHGAATLWGGVFGGKPRRVNLPVESLAETARALWRAEGEGRLAFVVGDEWLAGNLSLSLDGRPQVLLYGDLRLSPWIEAEALRRAGALVVWDAGRRTAAPPWAAGLPGFRELGTTSLAWPDHPAAAPLELGWGLLDP